MSLINDVRLWLGEFRNAPDINYLGAKVGEWSIEAVPSTSVVKRYVDGGCVRQFVFVIALREEFCGDNKTNEETAMFFESLEKWIRRRDSEGKLPKIEGGKVRSAECTSHGYAINSTQRTVRYQMQCRITYYTEF